MRVKITLSEPSIVAQGGTWEQHGWGPYQFPGLSQLDDGRFLATFAHPNRADSVLAYEEINPVYESWDGIHWKECSNPNLVFKCTARLPSGDWLSPYYQVPVTIDETDFPEPANRGKFKDFPEHTYAIDSLPDKPFEKKWPFRRIKNGEDTPFIDYAELDWPHMFVNKVFYDNDPGFLPPFAINGHTRIAPDGTIWRTIEMRGCLDPDNGGYSPYYAVYYFSSKDNAKSFQLQSWIPYLPDTREFKNAWFCEGYNEGDIAFMPDGSMITLLRTDSVAPSYLARSVDNGKTWSKTVKFDKLGVCPVLCSLPCGVTLASYGRPGFYIRATSDPSGLEWDDPITIIAPEMTDEEILEGKDYWGNVVSTSDGSDRCTPRSCSYSDLIPLDDNSALLIYSDFTVPNAKGVPCKTILTRKVTVEIL